MKETTATGGRKPNARLRRIEGRHNSLVKELRQAFSRGELTSDGYCAIEGFRILDEAIRSGLRFRAVSSASRRRRGRKNCSPNSALRSRRYCCRTSCLPAPSPATRRRAWQRWRAGKNSRWKTSWQDPKRALAGHCGGAGPGKSGDNPAIGGGLRRRRSAAGRRHGQPFQSQSCAGFGRFGIPAAGGASKAV